MLVDLDARRLVDDAGHLERRLAARRTRCRAWCRSRDSRAGCRRRDALLVPPGGRLLPLDLLGRDLDLVGEVEERAAVAVVEMHLDQLADRALVDQPLGGVVRRIPGERPVDGEPRRGPAIAAIIRRASAALAAKGFSTMTLMPCGAIASTVSACSRGRRADDGEVGARPARQASRSVKTRSSGMPKVAIAGCHAARGPGRRCRRSRRRDARRPGAAGRPCACGRS